MTQAYRVIEAMVGDGGAPALGEALEARAQIMALSQAAHDAVLAPAAPGGLAHDERAALAARMASLNDDAGLVAHYLGLLDAASADADVRRCADPAATSGFGARRDAILRHVDLLTRLPSAATRADIQALTAAGVAEPDIVRLAELIAFVNYQARVIAGLKLLQAVS